MYKQFISALTAFLLAVVVSPCAADLVATTEDQEATGFADSRKIVRDASTGRLYVAYRAKIKQNNATNYRIFVRFSDDEGATWALCNGGSPVDTEGSYKQRVPSIAIGADSARTLHLAWYGLHAGKQENQREIKYSRSTNQCSSWSSTTRITDAGGFDAATYSFWQEHPVVLTYGNFVYIAWEGRDGSTPNGGIQIVRSGDRGVSFGATQFVQRWTDFSFSRPSLVAIGSTTAPTLWLVAHAFDASDIANPRKVFWSKSTDNGDTWLDWARVCAACTGDQRHISISRDTGGKAHVVWRENAANGYSQIYYAKSTTSAFGSPIAVSPISSYQFSPHVEVDQAAGNKIYVVWSETTNASGFPGEKPADGFLYSASKADTAASFSGRTQQTFDGFATYPTFRRTTKTFEGNLDLVWTEYTNGSASTTFRVQQRGLPR